MHPILTALLYIIKSKLLPHSGVMGKSRLNEEYTN